MLLDQEKSNEIWRIWKEYPRECGCRVPKFVMLPQAKGCLLFLGYNPSLPRPGRSTLWVNTVLGGRYPDNFRWANSGLVEAPHLDRMGLYARVHHEAREHYPWFKALNRVADGLGCDQTYGHVDLFAVPCASSAGLDLDYCDERWLQHRADSPNHVQRQLAVSFGLVEDHAPRLIVAVYKSAADVFLGYYRSRIAPVGAPQVTRSHAGQVLLRRYTVNIAQNPTPLLSCNDLPGQRGGTLDELVEATTTEW